MYTDDVEYADGMQIGNPGGGMHAQCALLYSLYCSVSTVLVQWQSLFGGRCHVVHSVMCYG